MTSKTFLGLVVSFVILSDRLAKVFITQRTQEAQGFPVIPGFFHITRVNNTGAAFGILKDSQNILILISALFILGILAWWSKNSHRPLSPMIFGWSLVLAGAASNLYDRVCYGYVIDFLDFRIWPVFNLADTSICVGIFLVFFDFLSKSRKRT